MAVQCFEPMACMLQVPAGLRTQRYSYLFITLLLGLETSSFCSLIMIGAFFTFCAAHGRYVFSPYSFGLSTTSQQYFSLRTNQPSATSQQNK
jgi:hypothetical protein